MKTSTKQIAMLLFTGFLMTLSSAVNTCPQGPLNETAVCGNITVVDNRTDYCSLTFKLYACSNVSVLAGLQDDLLVIMSACYNNATVLDPAYSSLFFSKLDSNKTNALLSRLNNQSTSLSPEWSKFLLDGIWSWITQYLNGSAAQSQWIPSYIQPFLAQITPNVVQCLQQKNVTCASFQELVKNLDMVYPNIALMKRRELYPALKMFLMNRQNVSGSSCSLNVSSSVWLKQNLGKFSEFAELSDFVALNANFSALDALSLLTAPQIANFCLDLDAANNSAAIGSILGMLQNASDVYNFLTYVNAAVMSRNMSAVRPPLAQALLNKTFEAVKSNISMFTSLDWAQLFQEKLNSVLSEITPDQLSLIPQNISCDSYQAIFKGLNSKFSQMNPGKQENVYKSFIKPYQSKKGPSCSQNVNNSALIKQNFGEFSKFADYSDFVALNSNFSALDVLPLLTIRQKVYFSLTLNASSDPAAAGSIVGTLQNTSDVYNFLTYLNTAIMLNNMSSVSPPLSQALLNKTFEALKSNISTFNSSDWAQLFQDKLNSVLPDITPDQLSLVPQNISCDSYQAIIKGLDSNFPKMTSGKQETVYKSLVKPYLAKKGPACSQNVNSSVLIKQNFGKYAQFADYNDFVALNGNFSALEVLPILTVPQIVKFSVVSPINSTIAGSIVGTLKNTTDVYNFLSYLNMAVTSNNVSTVSPQLSQALLTKTFQVINFSSFSSSDWTQLFQDKLRSILPEISVDQLSLIPTNISCNAKPFKGLDSNFSKMAPGNQEKVYKSFIKPYVTKKGNTITCFNQSDVNSSSWFVTNLASFMTYTSEEDLALFANDSMLQIFANDPSSVQLASQLKFPKDTAIYYTYLLTSSGANVSSIPVTFLCYLKPSALKSLNSGDVLSIAKKINQQCFNTPPGQTPSVPTSEEVQVAMSLVSKLSSFSSDTIVSLGQSAVGLSPSQINVISDKDLESSLPSLSNVTGWNIGQAKSIMNKLLKSNFQIKNLESLGSLVSGLPSAKLKELDPSLILNAVKNVQFANKLSSAPPALQNMFVKQIAAADSNTSNLVKNVPGNLASFIPKSSLLFKSGKPVLQDINGKSWSADQASMFFDDIVSSPVDYSLLSSSVLQGFTCGTPSKIDNNQIKMLAKAMKTQNAPLSEDQLNCLSRQVTKNGYPTDLDKYPKEVFLFLNPSNYSAIGSCKVFFTKVGMANVNVLPKGSKLRNNLLAQSLSCMNVTGFSLTDDNIQVLGQLACDLNSSYIQSSSGNLLTQLSQCKSFTADQQGSIQKVISTGNSVFGAPSTWTKATLTSLGGMSGILTKDIVTNISSLSFKSWLKEAIQNSALTRDQFATIVKNLTPTRTRRAAGCPDGKQITADNVNEDLLPLSYTTDELNACLDNQTLLDYLGVLGNKAFTNEQLAVLKNKLDVIYPGGYPETVIPNLGVISFLCGESDIKKWNITSVDTLESLLALGPPESLAKIEIGKYTSLGNPLTDSALNIIGSQYICLLNSTQLDLITPSAISGAKALDVSACNQMVKDSLYVKANASFQGMPAYYNLIKPYLGGAPVADLKSLAAQSPNMDIGTFIKLNPSTVLNLTVSDVKGLLGNNVADLKSQETNPVVSAWIKVQKQSDLDTLGLGLLGGRNDNPYTTLSSSTYTTLSSSTYTTRKSGSSALTQGFSFLLAAVAATLLF